MQRTIPIDEERAWLLNNIKQKKKAEIKLFFESYTYYIFPKSYSFLDLLQAACLIEDPKVFALIMPYVPKSLTQKDDFELSLLHQACACGYLEAVQWLLAKHDIKEFEEAPNTELTPFKSAIYHPTLLAFFLEHYPIQTIFAESNQQPLINIAIQKYNAYASCQCDFACDCFAFAETCTQSIKKLLENGAGICADLTGLEEIEMNFKDCLFIGATCNNEPAQFQDAIHNAREFKEATQRGVIFRKSMQEISKQWMMKLNHESNEFIELKKMLPYFCPSLKSRCLRHICFQYENKAFSAAAQAKLPTELITAIKQCMGIKLGGT